MSYEVLVNRKKQVRTVPILSIGPGAYSGAFLNKIATALLGPHVQILYDADTQKLAFRPALSDSDVDHFTINSGQGAFSCAAIWSRIPKLDSRVSFVGEWNNEQSLLEFSLASLFGTEVAK